MMDRIKPKFAENVFFTKMNVNVVKIGIGGVLISTDVWDHENKCLQFFRA